MSQHVTYHQPEVLLQQEVRLQQVGLRRQVGRLRRLRQVGRLQRERLLRRELLLRRERRLRPGLLRRPRHLLLRPPAETRKSFKFPFQFILFSFGFIFYMKFERNFVFNFVLKLREKCVKS